MTTKQILAELTESRNYHTQLRELAKHKGNLEEVAIEQGILDCITREMTKYDRRLRK
jgi:hypothetical protein